MRRTKTELVILGGGPGGYVAAIRAGRLGLKTILVEKHKVGGICLNYGCIPTKVLLGKTALLESLAKGSRFGLSVENARLDFRKLSAFKDRVVRGLVKGVESILKSAGVNVMYEEGIFRDERNLELSSGGIIEFENAIIAAGSINRELPGLEVNGADVIDSTGALALEEVPDSMLVIGAGAIGLEMGLIFSRLGANVTVVEMMPEILPGMDGELAKTLRNVLTKGGMKFRLDSTVESIEKLPECGVAAKISGVEEPVKFAKVLVAVGRRPNSECFDVLKLERIKGGFVKVDEALDSSIPGIKVIGDLTGAPLLAHKASHQGIWAVECIAGKSGDEPFPPVSGAVFTEPEFASVGMTMVQAEAQGMKAFEYIYPVQAVSRARTMAVSEGSFKIVADDSGKILGVHILAPGAGDLIAEAALAIRLGLKAKDLADNIHIHPTMSEGLMEAALMADGRGIHI